MKKVVTLFIGAALSISVGQAQKKLLTLEHFSYDNYNLWRKIEQARLSYDGKFLIYELHPGLTVQSTEGTFKREFPGYNIAFDGNSFSPDGRYFVTRGNNNLGIYEFAKDNFEEIRNVSDFKITNSIKKPLLVYHHNGDTKDLVLRNLLDGHQKVYHSVEEYLLSDNGDYLIFTENIGSGQILKWISLSKLSEKAVANTAGKFSCVKLDHAAKTITAIETVMIDGKDENNLLVCSYGSDQIFRIDNDHPAIAKNFAIASEPSSFAFNNRLVIFKLQPIVKKSEKRDEVMVLDIWHYRDYDMPSSQTKSEANSAKDRYHASLNLGNGKVIILDSANDNNDIEICGTANTHVGFISERIPDRFALKKTCLYAVDLLTGKRTKIYGGSEDSYCNISPNGKYAFYFHQLIGKGFVYEVETGINRVVTNKIPYSIGNRFLQWPMVGNPSIGRAGWLDEGNSIVLYDEYDVWKVDLRGKIDPVCLTKGYGRRNGVVLRLAKCNGTVLIHNPQLLDSKTPLVLIGQNVKTKDQGFYTFDLEGTETPHLLRSGPYEYVRISNQMMPMAVGFDNHLRAPLKAKNANAYAFFASNVKEGLQLHFTKDNFKTSKPLTHIKPHKEFNWMTSELITWTMFDGKQSQGVLYKPENFDPKKKYPVIFTYYEKNSDALNSYPFLQLCDGPIFSSIPYFVSNGYLVFVPDIHYELGNVNEDVYNSVASAAKHMTGNLWVDAKHMAITGHSFGGYETMCLATRSGNLFASAMAASGVSDVVSIYGHDPQITVGSQLRIGGFPWQNPKAYIDNSPLFHADKIEVPLLLMNNDGDTRVPIFQGVEMFVALRQLHKPVWLLNYKGEGHQGGGMDFMTRTVEFFDHYLKGKPAPKWMSDNSRGYLRAD